MSEAVGPLILGNVASESENRLKRSKTAGAIEMNNNDETHIVGDGIKTAIDPSIAVSIAKIVPALESADEISPSTRLKFSSSR